MRRRLLIACFVLDGLCAVAAPILAPTLFDRSPADQTSGEAPYVEIAGLCVETVEIAGADAAGRPVDMALCAGS